MNLAAKALFTSLTLAASIAIGAAAHAQAYPDKTITVVSGFPAGGGTDAIARYISNSVAKTINGTIIVENRPGAGGGVAATYVKSRPADGYTILQTISGTLSVEPVFEQLEFTRDDYVVVGAVARFQEAIVSRADLPWNNLGEVLAGMKKGDERVTYGSQARNDRMVLAQINAHASRPLVVVPFSGGPDLRTALLGGHIDLGFSGSRHVPLINNHELKAMAVIGEERYASLPDTPTLMELGIPFALNMYSIFAVPAGTPDDVIKKLSDAIVAAAKEPGFQKLATKLDIVAIPLDSAAASDMVNRQIKQVKETKALMDE